MTAGGAVDWPGSLLARKDRANEVVVAPPHGLTLVAVGYPDDPAAFAARAALTRNRRVRSGSIECACRTQGDGDNDPPADGGVFSIDHSSITFSRRYCCSMS